MTSPRIALLAGVALAALAAVPAHADFIVGPLTVDPSPIGPPPAAAALSPIDLSGFSVGLSSGSYLLADGVTLDLGGISAGDAGVAGVVRGALLDKYATPVTDASGDLYAGNYLATGIGSITLRFPSLESVFALLWGSVDGYNTIRFDTLAGPVSFTGAMMPASDGSRGFGGSFYTTIYSAMPFTSVTLISTDYAFEAADFAYGAAVPGPAGLVSGAAVPEPAGMAVLGMGLLGLALARRKVA